MSIAAAPSFLACLLVGLSPGPDQPAFAPAAGLRLEKTLQGKFELELHDWSCRTNGAPVPSEYLPELEIESHHESRLEWSDEHLASASNHPQRLRRTFEKLASKRSEQVSVNGQQVADTERIGKSALEGCVVLFDESGGGERKLERGECARDLLDGLPIDLDLTGLLPPDAKTNEWQVDASALNVMQEHDAGVRFTYDKEEDEQHIDPAQLEKNVQGKWKVTRGTMQQVEGARVLSMHVQGEFTSSCEIQSELRNVPVAQGKTRETGQASISAEGEILWDLERRVLHSASVHASYTLKHHTETEDKSASGTPAYDQDMEFRGSFEFALETRTSS